jgi:hypothetical protein
LSSIIFDSEFFPRICFEFVKRVVIEWSEYLDLGQRVVSNSIEFGHRKDVQEVHQLNPCLLIAIQFHCVYGILRQSTRYKNVQNLMTNNLPFLLLTYLKLVLTNISSKAFKNSSSLISVNWSKTVELNRILEMLKMNILSRLCC